MIKISVKTNRKEELVDITAQVAAALKKDGSAEGVCHVYCPHTTCALAINENADPSVKRDITGKLSKVISEDFPYEHAEGNSPAHIKTVLTGNSLTVFFENSGLLLGTWQGLYLCEFDGPREREVCLKVIKG